MPDDSPIRIFVAHLFERSTDYLRVFEYLESHDRLRYVNTADPDIRPAGGREAVREELRRQIGAAEIVVMPMNTCAAGSDLVAFQLDVAGAFSKPAVMIKSFGETVALHKDVLARAVEIVDWNERALVDAIRRHARHEETSRWEVIEFKLED